MEVDCALNRAPPVSRRGAAGNPFRCRPSVLSGVACMGSNGLGSFLPFRRVSVDSDKEIFVELLCLDVPARSVQSPYFSGDVLPLDFG